MEYTLETHFLRRPIRKLIIDDEFWYVISDVFRAVGKDAIQREEPMWSRKWPESCRRFEIIDKDNRDKTVNALCAQADQLMECFGTERTNRMSKMYRWLLNEWRIDMDWSLRMNRMRTIAACEDEDEKQWLEEMYDEEDERCVYDEHMREETANMALEREDFDLDTR